MEVEALCELLNPMRMARRNMSGQSRKHKAPVLAQAAGRSSRSISAVFASLCLLGISAGFARPAAASEMPKISTPQVRVSTGVHVNTPCDQHELKRSQDHGRPSVRQE
jgi:hypothetical protein